MKIDRINTILKEIFPQGKIENQTDNSWQIVAGNIRILVLLSDDSSWLKILTPIGTQQDAKPLLEFLMGANFDSTGEARYALGQNVLWGIFQHSFESLTESDFCSAITQWLALRDRIYSIIGRKGFIPSFPRNRRKSYHFSCLESPIK